MTPGPPSERTSSAHTAITGAVSRSMSPETTTSNARFTRQDEPVQVRRADPHHRDRADVVARPVCGGEVVHPRHDEQVAAGWSCGVRTASSSRRSEKSPSVTSRTSAPFARTHAVEVVEAAEPRE